VTGWLNTPQQTAAYVFQVTFFRRRVDATQGMRSPLAARQLLFAHAALTDVGGQKLWHDQRLARWSGQAPQTNALDLASASLRTTAVSIGDWSLVRSDTGLSARVQTPDFALDLSLAARQPVLPQGSQGLSRKGPQATQASYYYSQPQLAVSGTCALRGKPVAVAAGSTAWLDHEWSDALLHPDAVGWDWIGINLHDGSALTAFQVRDATGAALWDGGSFRGENRLTVFQRGDVVFTPGRRWKSPQTAATYPVQWTVRTPLGEFLVRALADPQELDSRVSTGAVYWEGLCMVTDASGTVLGFGYLEMAGYAAPLRL